MAQKDAGQAAASPAGGAPSMEKGASRDSQGGSLAPPRILLYGDLPEELGGSGREQVLLDAQAVDVILAAAACSTWGAFVQLTALTWSEALADYGDLMAELNGGEIPDPGDRFSYRAIYGSTLLQGEAAYHISRLIEDPRESAYEAIIEASFHLSDRALVRNPSIDLVHPSPHGHVAQVIGRDCEAFERLSRQMKREGVSWLRICRNAEVVRQALVLDSQRHEDDEEPSRARSHAPADSERTPETDPRKRRCAFDVIAVMSQDFASSTREAQRLSAIVAEEGVAVVVIPGLAASHVLRSMGVAQLPVFLINNVPVWQGPEPPVKTVQVWLRWPASIEEAAASVREGILPDLGAESHERRMVEAALAHLLGLDGPNKRLLRECGDEAMTADEALQVILKAAGMRPAQRGADGLLGPGEWPTSVEEAVVWLVARLDEHTKAQVAAADDEALNSRNHAFGSFGQGLRNCFGMWRGNCSLLQDCGTTQPDDASLVIMRALRDHLRQNMRMMN